VVRSLLKDCRAAAAAEMALVLPLLLLIMFSSIELGNYFMNEHKLVEAVRNGARFAARQSFSNYTACSGAPDGTVVSDTRNVVMNGYLSGGTVITPNIQAADIDVSTSCISVAGGETMTGIYVGRPGGAQKVTVAASVNYRPVISAVGFTGIGFKLNAKSEAAVSGS
jgi:Flp pilus assembly protein TadG